MERRSKRVSASQWDIALDFLQEHRNLVRGYNNSSRARELSQRLWRELAELLNAEGSGATKTPKDWATYFNNFKSKLKKMVSDLNNEGTATGGGPPTAESLSEVEQRFLALMGSGFGQGATNETATVQWNPQPPDAELLQNAELVEVFQEVETEEVQIDEVLEDTNVTNRSPQPSTSDTQQTIARNTPPPAGNNTPAPTGVEHGVPPLPRQTRRTRRYHTRPMAPIDEARRILSQVEMQRAAADAEQARALHLIGQNLGRLADVVERYFANNQNAQ